MIDFYRGADYFSGGAGCFRRVPDSLREAAWE